MFVKIYCQNLVQPITTDYGVLNYRLIRPIHYHSHPPKQVWIKKNSQIIRNISKQYEQRVVKSRLTEYLSTNNLLNPH